MDSPKIRSVHVRPTSDHTVTPVRKEIDIGCLVVRKEVVGIGLKSF